MNKWFQLMTAIAFGLFIAQLLWFLLEVLIVWIHGLVSPCGLKFY